MRDDGRSRLGERRRTGRPSLDADKPSAVVSARLTADDYDALYALARIRRVDMSSVVREAIINLLVLNVIASSS